MTGLGPGAVWTALLDACVLVPAPLRDTLLRFAEVGLYRPKWSDQILEETRRNILKLSRQPPGRTDAMLTVMNAAFEDAEVTGYEDLIRPLKTHRKDRHVLAAAIAGRAHVIVTFDLRHFPEESVKPYEIEVQP